MRDDEREVEQTLVDILARISETDDPSVADNAIELYLNRYGDDHAARMIALRRLTTALLTRGEDAAAAQTAAAVSARR